VPSVLKSGSLNLLEPSGPVNACNGIALSLSLCIYILLFMNTMGMSHLTVINTSQVYIHKYENLKRKLYNFNANIYFNQKFLKKYLNPNYAMIKVPNASPASKYTQYK
jgi:hypothetical protein